MIPVKPFDSYKWRWLSVQPTESLLDPPVFLGVLRVLARHEGERPSTPEIETELNTVQSETNTTVNLARSAERNIIRNSGQYWKGTGLLTPDKGGIQLTSLGRQIAAGRITQSEFAAIMVQQTILPNPWTYSPEEIAKWKAANLEIRPLALILEIIGAISRNQGGMKDAYITPKELIRVAIPLAGMRFTALDIANYVIQFRRGNLDISAWPDCAPEANDTRLAREFLLFLSNFGLCRRVENGKRLEDRYFADEVLDVVASLTTASIFAGDEQADQVVNAVRHSTLPSLIERQRTTTTVLSRQGQPKFRKQILRISQGQCLITGERIGEVLEAAHIIPVTSGGADETDNGICLRVDIHRLFDSGNIRLRPSGELQFSDAIKTSQNYGILPQSIVIPSFIKMANVEWRYKYL
jgi:hypothetical protein